VATKNLALRILAAGLPLVVIALVAGAAGYFTKSAESTPIPPLLSGDERPVGVQGAIQSFTDGQLTIATNDGTQLTFELPEESAVEQLTPLSRGDLSVGDWINGGAIPHRQTVLALVGLVLITDPVIQTP
jgi:hypothetical protein